MQLPTFDIDDPVLGDACTAFDAGLIKRAVSNLLSNAIRYAYPGTEVMVRIQRQERAIALVVSNTGPELAPGALPRLFDRFYRGQSSREGSSENHGLGLAIVKAIAQMHGGEVLATSDRNLTSIGMTLALVSHHDAAR